jgi:hypothetical protein
VTDHACIGLLHPRVLSCLTYAAGACTLAVHVYLERDVRACDILPPRDCSRVQGIRLASPVGVRRHLHHCRAAVLSLSSARPPPGLSCVTHSRDRLARTDGPLPFYTAPQQQNTTQTCVVREMFHRFNASYLVLCLENAT